ncbi:hypothetical protein FA95DRAFT_1012709 [Auriscalpium vulgare]|uniref:Uncharacterized protein n=1 Tax=Auriscalpium vulgare TaxID=40419 RepID=A0ACB8R7N5_9AGAM|nr:hypothetical protein FA95DRAFT_1012709 [Auriscalpium vulgare]
MPWTPPTICLVSRQAGRAIAALMADAPPCARIRWRPARRALDMAAYRVGGHARRTRLRNRWARSGRRLPARVNTSLAAMTWARDILIATQADLERHDDDMHAALRPSPGESAATPMADEHIPTRSGARVTEQWERAASLEATSQLRETSTEDGARGGRGALSRSRALTGKMRGLKLGRAHDRSAPVSRQDVQAPTRAGRELGVLAARTGRPQREKHFSEGQRLGTDRTRGMLTWTKMVRRAL